MKKILTLLYISICFPFLLYSQVKYDYIWPFGNGEIKVSNGIVQGGTLIDFKSSPPEITLNDFIIDFPFASIADKDGNLVAFTDGCRISNRNKDLMLNGDSLNPGEVYNVYCNLPYFYPVIQPCIFIPKPGSDSLYYLFHLRSDDHYRNPMNLLYTEIDASGDNGNGAVISKNNTLLSDSIYLGQFVTATRHANGRDWWVVVTRRFHSEIHVTLVTSDTVQYMGMQDVGFTEVDNGYCCNQTRFTPDGSRFFRNHPGGMLILDFDRCSGTFSNPVYWDYHTMPTGSGGVAISYDNRFLYLCTGDTVQQYDLRAPDILASREIVAEYDGFMSPEATYFFHAALAPDGKIYILTTTNNDILHVIHSPNKKGIACKVEQHGIKLPARGSFFEPNFPNYRLGPLDGSPCDTLGIDNLPVAHFRFDVLDTLSPQQIEFTDLSYYEPDTWQWDFGDGTTSQDTSPTHLYSTAGSYIVCLTVCNANACDTVCKEVEVKMVSGITLYGEEGEVQLWPNPFRENISINADAIDKPLVFNLFDNLGRQVVRQAIVGKAVINTQNFPPGIYFWSVELDELMVKRGKCVKE